MSFQPIHIHKSSYDKGSNVFLLLIPAVIFALVIAAYMLRASNRVEQISTTLETNVLGDEAELDKR